MIKQKILTLLVLLMTAVSGAWAGAEPPLITIESKDYTSFKSGSQTFDNKVTVTFSGNVSYDSEYGWFSAQERTLTVTAAEGYTITGVRFSNNSGFRFVSEAPFEAILGYDDNNSVYFAKVNGTSIGTGDAGVTKIEVYGYADTPAASTYTVSLKEGTEDATSWQGKAGSGEYQALPLEGVAAGTAVTVKYDGRKRVRSVKAVKKGGALTMEALTDGNIVVNIMSVGGARRYDFIDDFSESRKRAPGRRGSSNISWKYSVNGGEKTTINEETTTIDVNAGDKVQFYGNGPDMSNYCVPNIAGGTAQVKVYGNIMSMLDEDNYATLTTLPFIAFYVLFGGNENLTDASGLLLPATTLAEACYYGMFYGCTSLTTAPALPATELAGGCYGAMFSGCTSLTAAPALPATELAEQCYNSMFSGCTSLTTAPTLPATTLAGECYSEMFYGCTSLSSITCLATEGINENGSTSDWVNGVATTGTFTKASGATWPEGANGIPSGWTVNEQ